MQVLVLIACIGNPGLGLDSLGFQLPIPLSVLDFDGFGLMVLIGSCHLDGLSLLGSYRWQLCRPIWFLCGSSASQWFDAVALSQFGLGSPRSYLAYRPVRFDGFGQMVDQDCSLKV